MSFNLRDLPDPLQQRVGPLDVWQYGLLILAAGFILGSIGPRYARPDIPVRSVSYNDRTITQDSGELL